MASELFMPKSKNLSLAWTEAFLALVDHGVKELTPLILSVTDIEKNGFAKEVTPIRQRLDNELLAQGQQDSHTVANTIFPQSLWNPNVSDNATKLYERYERIWPVIKKYSGNHRGVYFRRLSAYSPRGSTEKPVNQLRHIVDTYNAGNHRRSALQASLFDPTRDHTHSRQQGFPCLQQIAFLPLDKGGLCVTGFYPTQYLFERAYGNYLGLCRLGRFMAMQMRLSLVQMVCVSTVAQLGNTSKHSKGQLQSLASDLRRIISKI